MSAATLASFPTSKQSVRVRRFLLAAGAYAVCLPLLVLANALGLIGAVAASQIAAAMVTVNVCFYLAFLTGYNERFTDPSLTWLQVLAALGVLMFAVYHFDKERSLALMLSMVVLAFGTFRFTTREFLTAAGVALAAYAGVINVLMWLKPGEVNVWLEAYHWIQLAIVLPCFAFVCGRVSEMRQRVRRTNDELSSALSMIQRLATHDSLTGMPNRALFNESLGHAIAKSDRYDRPLAIFFLDLDRFKNINDTLGHAVGDRVPAASAPPCAAAT
jgi:diguanylate cyclase